MNILRILYLISPERYKRRIEDKGRYADIKDYERLSSSLGLIGSLLSIGFALLLPVEYTFKLLILSTAPVLYFIIPLVVFTVAAERRKSEIERMLPEALLLMSNNLESGASINQAFLESAREEFGPLKKEFKITARQISGGNSVEQAIRNLRDRVNSDIFQDTLRILTNTLESGGNTADLLESSAEDIRKSLELRDEIESSVQMYVIFIFIAAVIGAPFLFGITTYMAETTTQLWQQTDTRATNDFSGTGSSVSFQKPDINIQHLTIFSISVITITNFFSSLIISQIKNGNIKKGFKIIPVSVGLSVTIFYTVRSALTGLI